VSDENHWMVQHHVMFSGYYFFQFCGLDRNAHRAHKDHPAYEQTRHFVANWDGPSFDPKYDSLPLDAFEPLVRTVLGKPPKSAWRATGIF
jgi:hypothetical protein